MPDNFKNGMDEDLPEPKLVVEEFLSFFESTGRC